MSARQRTYWHLCDLGRVPSDYDIATSQLLYYSGRGFEVHTPLADWHARYQLGSPFRLQDWELFRDPRETTYTRYTEIQKTEEALVEGLRRSLDPQSHDRGLDSAWLDRLDGVLGTLRYPVHGLQMIAAYVGSMAPSGRIAIVCLLQAADEVRRIQHLAQRMRELQYLRPAFGTRSLELWREDAHWQPLREAIEKLLVTYDWGEALIALNLVLKPAFDTVCTVHLASEARRNGDALLAHVLISLERDCRWHRQWSRALMQLALAESADTRALLERCAEHWRPAVERAVHALARPFALDERTCAQALRAVDENCLALLETAESGEEGGGL